MYWPLPIQSEITGSWDSDSGVLTLSGSCDEGAVRGGAREHYLLELLRKSFGRGHSDDYLAHQ